MSVISDYFDAKKLAISPVFLSTLTQVLDGKKSPLKAILRLINDIKQVDEKKYDDKRALGELNSFFREHKCEGFVESKEPKISPHQLIKNFHGDNVMINLKKLYPEFGEMFHIMGQCSLIGNIVISGLTEQRFDNMKTIWMVSIFDKDDYEIMKEDGKFNVAMVAQIFGEWGFRCPDCFIWGIVNKANGIRQQTIFKLQQNEDDLKRLGGDFKKLDAKAIMIWYDEEYDELSITIVSNGFDFNIMLRDDELPGIISQSPTWSEYVYAPKSLIINKKMCVDLLDKRVDIVLSKFSKTYKKEVEELIQNGYSLNILAE